MQEPKCAVDRECSVRVATDAVVLEADLGIPPRARGVVLLPHGSGNRRRGPRNRAMARRLRAAGFATLRIDLLTPDEEHVDSFTRHLRSDIGLLARRLIDVTDWVGAEASGLAVRTIGCFGAGTAASAALVAAARRPDRIGALVSRNGRPDLAGDALAAVRAPTLLIVGTHDQPALELNEAALDRIGAPTKGFWTVPGASYLFEEEDTLEEVARLATDWFERHVADGTAARRRASLAV